VTPGADNDFGFEAGQPVATVGFSYPAEDSEVAETAQEDQARLRREVMLRLLQMLTAGASASARRIGQRTLVLAYLAGATPFRTQKQLAEKLGVTAGRASQILNSAKREFAKLARAE
jgi:hypothetical protein